MIVAAIIRFDFSKALQRIESFKVANPRSQLSTRICGQAHSAIKGGTPRLNSEKRQI